MEIKDLPYSTGEGFPKIVVDTPDKNTVALLKNLYASCGSETTAILQYIYQSYVVAPKEKEIADILSKIAMTEMHHHEELGRAIVAFGGVPFYTSSQGIPFSARCVYDGTNLKQMLLANINAEAQAIESYNNAIKKVNNESLKQFLTRIVNDEESHKKTFECLLEYVSFYK
jgi:bacterioferritin